MEDKIGSGENMPNLPPGMDELVKELDSMSVEDLREELEILLTEMDEDSFDGELLEVYLDAIDRKSPQPQYMDTDKAYKLFLKQLRDGEREKTKHRNYRGALKTGLIVAAVVALLAASMVVAQASGLDLFGKIARWTAETFGFVLADPADNTGKEIPPQLQGMKDALSQYGIGADYLPSYWPEGYEQAQVESLADPESNRVSGAYYEENGKYIILSYVIFLSERPMESYNIDDQALELHEHNKIEFHIMTNAERYLAVWNSGDVECRISGLESYEELIKILDSIGG